MIVLIIIHQRYSIIDTSHIYFLSTQLQDQGLYCNKYTVPISFRIDARNGKALIQWLEPYSIIASFKDYTGAFNHCIITVCRWTSQLISLFVRCVNTLYHNRDNDWRSTYSYATKHKLWQCIRGTDNE